MGLELNFSIDARTKIIILAILSFMVFNDVPFYVSGILVLIPFLFLFLSDYKKIALIYILIYVIAKFLQISILPTATGILSVLLIAFSYTATRMLPILVMGYYTISTTKVSEFIASMEKSNVPKDILMPISVIAVKTADELSAASLTRGLSNPQKRTHLISVSFNKFDYLFILIAVVGLGIYVYYSLGGVLLA